MNSPVTPWVLAGRIFAIVGMSFFAAVAILFFIGGLWLWGLGAAVLFFPFLGLIVVVERWQAAHGLIGPPDEATESDPD